MSDGNLREALFTEFGLFSSGEGCWHWRNQQASNLDNLSGAEAVVKTITLGSLIASASWRRVPAWRITVRTNKTLRHFETTMDNEEMNAVARLFKDTYERGGHEMRCFVFDSM